MNRISLIKRTGLCLAAVLFLVLPLRAEDGVGPKSRRARAYNELAFDIPFGGGGLVNYARMWPIARYFHAGVQTAGGVIDRDFTVTGSGFPDLDMKTKTVMFPFIGPRVTAFYHVIGISLSFGYFYGRTTVDATGPGLAPLSGKVSGWGTGFYSPLLVMDFYDEKRGIFVGFGLGGLLGASFPTLKAKNDTLSVESTASPIDALTFTIRTRWVGPSSWRHRPADDDF